ncbi:MAG: hypothetical protein WC966_02660 [Bradymonadales bacterium]|jgi:sugar (pentulose or hexulose) kinase
MTKPQAVVAISIDQRSIALSLVDSRGALHNERLEHKIERFHGLASVTPTALFADINKLMLTLPPSIEVAAITLSSPQRETAVLRGGKEQYFSPILFDAPLKLAASELPAHYQNLGLGSVYAESLLRRIRSIEPEFALNMKVGIAGVGALVAEHLTGRFTDFCRSFGMPFGGDPEHKDIINEALGIDENLSQEYILQGSLIGYLRPELCEAWKLGKIAVYAGGDAKCAALYATTANPVAWGLSMGWRPYLGWMASREAFATYSLRIAEAGLGSSKESLESWVENAEEHSRDEWAALILANFSEEYSIINGPSQSLSSFIHQWAPLHTSFFTQFSQLDTARVEEFKAPVGSRGLRIVPKTEHLQVIGLSAGHSAECFWRALFEACFLETRRLREQLGIRAAAPPRLVLEEPWSLELASVACDILAEPLIVIPYAASTLSAIGSALVLARQLNLLKQDAGPKIESIYLEPSARAAAYQPHFEVHCLLQELLAAI